MGQFFAMLLGATFGYITVCAGILLYYSPSLRSQNAQPWWRDQLTHVGSGTELLALLACTALAGFALHTLFKKHALLKSVVAMTLAVVAALHHPLGDVRRPDIALLAQWHLSAPFILGPAIVVAILNARTSTTDAFRRRFHRLDPWLRKIGYFRRR